MDKNASAEKAFLTYRNTYLGDLINRGLEPLLKRRKKDIKRFRQEWLLGNGKIKNQKDYEEWHQSIQTPLAHKRKPIAFLEEEVAQNLIGFKVVSELDYRKLEGGYRVADQGDSLEAVFDCEFRNLMVRLEIDPDWWNLVRHYILTNNLLISTFSHPNIEVTKRYILDQYENPLDERLSLIIGPNTRKEEIDLMWHYVIEPLQEKMKTRWKGKFRKRPTDKIAKELIKKWKREGSLSKAVGKLKTAENEWDFTKASKAISRHKKRLQT